ncbi:MAG TPA: hypothetical protein PKZ12_06755 [Smithellaceae bacterium]|nr:hypothetical protein [Smithellaceae bacterium]
MRDILNKIDGVVRHEIKKPDMVIINFDNERTSLEAIKAALKKGNFRVTGDSVFLN